MHVQLKMNLQQPELNGFGQVSYETGKRKGKKIKKPLLFIQIIFSLGKKNPQNYKIDGNPVVDGSWPRRRWRGQEGPWEDPHAGLGGGSE